MDSLRHHLFRIIALLSATFLIASRSSTQVFPRITFTDLYWLQYMVNNNPPPSGIVNYADSGYYYPQMERLGITHTVTVGDATGLGTVSSAIKVFNAYSTVWDNYRRGLENRYELGGPTTHDPSFDYPPTPYHEMLDGSGYAYYALVASDSPGRLLHGTLPWENEWYPRMRGRRR